MESAKAEYGCEAPMRIARAARTVWVIALVTQIFSLLTIYEIRNRLDKLKLGSSGPTDEVDNVSFQMGVKKNAWVTVNCIFTAFPAPPTFVRGVCVIFFF